MEMENLLKYPVKMISISSSEIIKEVFYYILMVHQVGFSQPAPHTWFEIKDGGQTMSWSYRRLLVDNTTRVSLPQVNFTYDDQIRIPLLPLPPPWPPLDSLEGRVYLFAIIIVHPLQHQNLVNILSELFCIIGKLIHIHYNCMLL